MRTIPAIAVAFALTGCLDGELRRSFDDVLARKPEKPPGKEPALEAAARVDQVGRQIVAANPFAGADVGFQTLGADEPVVFHRDAYNVFVSDALVRKCKSDGELAAVLCHEMGKMIAERRNAERMGVPDPVGENLVVPNSMEAGGIPADQVRLAELGMHEKKFPKKLTDRAKEKFADPKVLAADLHRTAGFAEADFAAVEKLVRDAEKETPLVRQLAGPGLAPRWSK